MNLDIQQNQSEEFSVQMAGEYDIPQILPLMQDFAEESAWGFTYNAQNAVVLLYNYMTSPETSVLIVRRNSEVVGWAMLAYDNEFHNERVGYLSKFYIAKAARGTTAARMLAHAATHWFDSMNCHESFATATAQIESEGNAFSNLLSKFGYRESGATLSRRRVQ
jgi:L-amino acid N-acyltransferase YncA